MNTRQALLVCVLSFFSCYESSYGMDHLFSTREDTPRPSLKENFEKSVLRKLLLKLQEVAIEDNCVELSQDIAKASLLCDQLTNSNVYVLDNTLPRAQELYHQVSTFFDGRPLVMSQDILDLLQVCRSIHQDSLQMHQEINDYEQKWWNDFRTFLTLFTSRIIIPTYLAQWEKAYKAYVSENSLWHRYKRKIAIGALATVVFTVLLCRHYPSLNPLSKFFKDSSPDSNGSGAGNLNIQSSSNRNTPGPNDPTNAGNGTRFGFPYTDADGDNLNSNSWNQVPNGYGSNRDSRREEWLKNAQNSGSKGPFEREGYERLNSPHDPLSEETGFSSKNNNRGWNRFGEKFSFEDSGRTVSDRQRSHTFRQPPLRNMSSQSNNKWGSDSGNGGFQHSNFSPNQPYQPSGKTGSSSKFGNSDGSGFRKESSSGGLGGKGLGPHGPPATRQTPLGSAPSYERREQQSSNSSHNIPSGKSDASSKNNSHGGRDQGRGLSSEDRGGAPLGPQETPATQQQPSGNTPSNKGQVKNSRGSGSEAPLKNHGSHPSNPLSGKSDSSSKNDNHGGNDHGIGLHSEDHDGAALGPQGKPSSGHANEPKKDRFEEMSRPFFEHLMRGTHTPPSSAPLWQAAMGGAQSLSEQRGGQRAAAATEVLRRRSNDDALSVLNKIMAALHMKKKALQRNISFGNTSPVRQHSFSGSPLAAKPSTASIPFAGVNRPPTSYGVGPSKRNSLSFPKNFAKRVFTKARGSFKQAPYVDTEKEELKDEPEECANKSVHGDVVMEPVFFGPPRKQECEDDSEEEEFFEMFKDPERLSEVQGVLDGIGELDPNAAMILLLLSATSHFHEVYQKLFAKTYIDALLHEADNDHLQLLQQFMHSLPTQDANKNDAGVKVAQLITEFYLMRKDKLLRSAKRVSFSDGFMVFLSSGKNSDAADPFFLDWFKGLKFLEKARDTSASVGRENAVLATSVAQREQIYQKLASENEYVVDLRNPRVKKLFNQIKKSFNHTLQYFQRLNSLILGSDKVGRPIGNPGSLMLEEMSDEKHQKRANEKK